MTDEPVSIVVAESDAGKRLDAALAGLLPGMGLRGRRRACDMGRAQVNGRARPAAYRTRPGDVLTLAAREEGDGAFLPRAVAHVLTPEKAEAGGLAALFKPAGMHCAALAGKPGVCLGDLLAELPELSLFRLALHVVGLFKQGRVHPLADLPLEAQPPAGDNHLAAPVVHHAEDVVVDDLFDAQILRPPPKKQTNPAPLSA